MDMKFSKRFNNDFAWYIKIRNIFNFDGHIPKLILHDPNGLTGKKAFFIFDTYGKLEPTRHPEMLQGLLRTKGSINLHIRMYAEGRSEGTLSLSEFEEICKEINAPDWFYFAVEKQKVKIYKEKYSYEPNFLKFILEQEEKLNNGIKIKY